MLVSVILILERRKKPPRVCMQDFRRVHLFLFILCQLLLWSTTNGLPKSIREREKANKSNNQDWGGAFGTHSARESITVDLIDIIGDEYDVRSDGIVQVISKETCREPENGEIR